MASLGYYLLLAAFVVSAYAAAMGVAGARRRSRGLIESSIGAFYLVAAIMTAATGVIVHAFLDENYAIKYVQRYSDAAQPLFYKLTAYWGGLDGSIMFWVFLLSLFGSAAVYVNRDRQRELIPYVVAVISTVQMFFLLLMVVHNNPFQTYLTETHADGNGLNPLLQNFYMAIHPPTMYLGFVGVTIPFAFAMAALITGNLDDSWLRAVRRWTMIAWLFLTIGLMLGMLWAYEELGWGGYWMWDPGRERRSAAVVYRHRLLPFGDGPGAPRHAARLEHVAHHRHILPDHLRHVHDAVGDRPVGARLRRGSRAGADVRGLHGPVAHHQLRPRDLPPAAAEIA
jgi:cytochrome c-type biogenesis protein CcmF